MYLSRTELEQRIDADELGRLLAGLDQSDADAKVANALGDAESTVNSYLSRRYNVPLQNATNQLKRWVNDIARYHLWDDGPSETVQNRHKQALIELRDIAAHRADLAGTSEAPVSDDSADALIHISTSVSKLDLEGY